MPRAGKDSRWQWSSKPWEMIMKSVSAASSLVMRSLSNSTWSRQKAKGKPSQGKELSISDFERRNKLHTLI